MRESGCRSKGGRVTVLGIYALRNMGIPRHYNFMTYDVQLSINKPPPYTVMCRYPKRYSQIEQIALRFGSEITLLHLETRWEADQVTIYFICEPGWYTTNKINQSACPIFLFIHSWGESYGAQHCRWDELHSTSEK